MIKTNKLEKKIKKFAKQRRLVYSIARNADDTVEIRIEPKNTDDNQVIGFRQ
jgi:hypothetical protein